MNKQFLTSLLLLSTVLLFGQSSDKPNRNIGINYYGELGFRPGVELDLGLSLWQKNTENSRIEQQVYLRPSLAYYHYPHLSNNILPSLKLNYQLKLLRSNGEKHLFIEPFVKIGYLRYFFIGDVFETQGNGFSNVSLGGSSSLVVGGGLDMGGYISPKFDWLFGFDYYAESTEDQLLLHRFVAKLGTRIKLNTK